jgi:cytidylate kinase
MSSRPASDVLTVAIDGPAASGKSTVALGLARRLGLALVDSGSMYRGVTLLAVERGVDLEDEPALVEIACELTGSFQLELKDGETLRVFIGEREVTEEIRMPVVGDAVSIVSEIPRVREEMVCLQRRMASDRSAVVEGRDIGTTVLPDASLKIYLEAPEQERASRRLLELQARGLEISREKVASEIEKRDRIDSSREVSPLRPAPDAVLLDTSESTAAEVEDMIIGLLADRGLID